MPFAIVNEDIKLYYEIHGKGEPLVLISGLGGDTTSWRLLLPLLSKHYQIILFDNRGAGKTKIKNLEFTLKDIARDLAALLDVLEIPKTHILGISMGGRIAQHFALDFPKKVDRLILACTAAYKTNKIEHLFKVQSQLTNKEFHSLNTRRLCIPWAFSENFFSNEAQVESVILDRQNRRKQKVTDFRAQFKAIYERDKKISLKRIKSKTLVICGEEDLITPPVCSYDLAKHIKSASVVLIPGGHAIHVESVKPLAKQVLSFLAEKQG